MMWPWEDPEYNIQKRDVLAPTASAYEGYDYATNGAGGLPYLKDVARYTARAAAPYAMGALAAANTPVLTGMVAGAAIPGAARSLYDALPLPGNQYSRIRQAGAPARERFYRDVNQGRYLSAGSDALEASGRTFGQYLRDLVPYVPTGGQ